MTLAQKAEVLGGLGVDALAVLPFTAEVAAWSAEGFAQTVLGGLLGARVVVVGANFRFGKDRGGDAATLGRMGAAQGFEVLALPAVEWDGQAISSSRIRADILGGDVARAAGMLGRRYFIDGTVVRGEGRGRTLGIPTANLSPVNELLPATGVYVCLAAVPGDGPRPAVVNVGRRPTFGGGAVTVEAHLLDFYGRPVRLEFAQFLRAEQAFPGVEALKTRIREDIARARHVLGAAI
jgi:riboflavin kinase/FMN adenylyltransferase